ncbi:MAG: hypothetical protein S4CHLAM2_04960 [Chlamydiales bacterium]|nr:hypothetical protein [Chlamydiales bacterium]
MKQLRTLYQKAVHGGYLLVYNFRRWARIVWERFTCCLQKLSETLRIHEVVFFFFFLIHRYRPGQMDLLHVPSNIHALFRAGKEGWLSANAKGELRVLSSPLQKQLFSLWNSLLLGAPQSRVEKVIYYTYITITLELNNPFDKKILPFFLKKKVALLSRMLKRVERINGKKWDQSNIKEHIDLFHRHSLLQYQVIQNMHLAVRRQKVPEVIQEARKALEKGLYPILITVGCSGAYWMRGPDRQIVGLFKPFDEEIHAPHNPVGPSFQGALGQRRTRWGCRVGEAAHHEVGAFLVDAFFGFGIVPRTYYAAFTHRTFFLAREDRLASNRPKKTKYGSFQEFVGGFVPFLEIYQDEKDVLPLVEYQLLIVLDVIIGNTDRHAGNILVGDEKIAAIDHGLCFPDRNVDLSYWYWKLEMGKEPLIPSLVDLLTHFPFERLLWKLKKNCFLTQNSLDRVRERVVLFTEGVKAGLLPHQLAGLMEPDYLLPLMEFNTTLPSKAQKQVELYRATQKSFDLEFVNTSKV